MTPDTKLKKKIDIIYRATKLAPILAIVQFFSPYIVIFVVSYFVVGDGNIKNTFIIWRFLNIVLPLLGLVFWFWRLYLLRTADSSTLGLDSVPPPLASAKQSGQISTAAKLDFIRRHDHFLLIPLYIYLCNYLWAVLAVVLFIFYPR